ncbi:hypothetical protein GEMRC1_009567 [Eukaryota sp. GEM-RC1]
MEHSDFEDSKPDDADQSHQTNWELKANMEDLNEEEDYGDPLFEKLLICFARCPLFNKIRTDFLEFLLSVDPAALNNHIFSDPHLGGIGFTSSKWWTKSAFICGGNYFVFEFCRRYPSQENLLVSTSSYFLVNLRAELSLISPDLCQTCFPADICEIPERCVTSLKFALKKFQKHLLKHFECLDFKIRLGSAKEKNPAFANFLIDLKDSSSVALINQIPQGLWFVVE